MLNRFRNWLTRSTQVRLLFWSMAFWAVSLTIIVVSLLAIGQNQMISQARQRNQQLASSVSKDLNQQMGSISGTVRSFSQHLGAIQPDLNIQAAAILGLRLSSPRYAAIYYFDGLGNLLFHSNESQTALLNVADPSEIVRRPPVSVPDYVDRTALEGRSGAITISDVHYTELERTPEVCYGARISFPSGETAIIVYVIDLSDVWQQVSTTTIGRTGITYVVSSNGTILSHDNPSLIREAMPSELAPFLPLHEGFREYSAPGTGRVVLGAYSPVGGMTGWGVVVEQDRTEANAPVRETGVLIFIIWAALALVGTAGIYLFIRNFTKPIRQLTRTTEEIALTGNLAQVGLTGRSDEVGRLSQAFDRMIGRVRATEQQLTTAYGEMETRVKTRTAELSDANERMSREILSRQQTEKLLKESESKYRELVEGANCIILEMDLQGNIVFLNKFGEEFFGYETSELIGRNVVGTIVPPTDSTGKNLEIEIRDIVKHPEAHYVNENENMRRNGDRVWISWTNKKIHNVQNDRDQILCFGIDRTAIKQAEQFIARQAGEKAAVAERDRLARDLHDAVSQTLFSASIIAEVLPLLWEKDRAEGRLRLEEIRQLTRGALAEMRTLLFELRPAALEDAEISYLLRQLGEAITGRTRLPVDVRIEGECDMPADVRISIYRITQEALNNIAKHADATRAEVSLICAQDLLELIVKDNGRGFDVAAARHESLGLGIMQERAQAIGAQLVIESSPGSGAQVIVRLRKDEVKSG